MSNLLNINNTIISNIFLRFFNKRYINEINNKNNINKIYNKNLQKKLLIIKLIIYIKRN
jgi:hypothetical protein